MSKSNTNRERREVVEQMRQQAKAAERRRTTIVVAICVVVALVIVGSAVYAIVKNNQHAKEVASQPIGDLGTSQTKAGCEPIQQQDGSGTGQHTTAPVDYATTPPAFGPHNPTADTSGVRLYTAADRPDVEVLVHNLEHGWTIVWYDDTIAADKDQLQTLKDTATKFNGYGSDPRRNMIIAPWTKDDGGGKLIPDDKHIAFTHWSVHQPVYHAAFFQTQKTIPSWGESQYCSTFSGAALEQFMKEFPYDDAPEGFLWHSSQ